MKPFLDVEKNRVAYHKASNKNTVHRSSLIVPRFDGAASNISFLNHFLIKRNNSNITLKVTAINSNGNAADSISLTIDEPIVYSFELENLFENIADINQYLVEFYSNENLFIPFPAVMVNHIGADFMNCVHSFNRVLNDIFENDAVNKTQVYESSIDVVIENKYDTFFNFATGPFEIKDQIKLSVTQQKGQDCFFAKDIPVEMKRLNNKNYYLSDLLNKSYPALEDRVTLKILQPQQPLFYGRLLCGIADRETKAFSANHSFYDNSTVEEYFENAESVRTYPYFVNCMNRILMYPIMSPSLLDVYIEIYSGDGSTFKSDSQFLKSPSEQAITFDVDELVIRSGFKVVTLFKVIAVAVNGNIPTRVNHQLIYGARNSKSKLNSSINVSLINENMFTPSYKTGLAWGQILVDKKYESRLGIRFNNNDGDKNEVSIDFYNKGGLFQSLNKELKPNSALIFDNDFFLNFNIEHDLVWYVAKSTRADLRADSFHIHRESHNSSGEHSF